jgi:hypothetical protein
VVHWTRNRKVDQTVKVRDVKEGEYFTHLRTGKHYKLLRTKTVKHMGTQYFCLVTGTGQTVRLHHSCVVELVKPP